MSEGKDTRGCAPSYFWPTEQPHHTENNKSKIQQRSGYSLVLSNLFTSIDLFLVQKLQNEVGENKCGVFSSGPWR